MKTIDATPLTQALDALQFTKRLLPAARHLRRQRQEAGQ